MSPDGVAPLCKQLVCPSSMSYSSGYFQWFKVKSAALASRRYFRKLKIPLPFGQCTFRSPFPRGPNPVYLRCALGLWGFHPLIQYTFISRGARGIDRQGSHRSRFSETLFSFILLFLKSTLVHINRLTVNYGHFFFSFHRLFLAIFLEYGCD